MSKKHFSCLDGFAHPLGTSHHPEGVNFAVFSQHATAISLCLFLPNQTEHLEIPIQNKTGHVWHVLIPNLPMQTRYGYRVDGLYDPDLGLRFDNTKILLDPYAKNLDAPTHWRQAQPYLAYIDPLPDFDWEQDSPPNIACKDLIIYEMHVRGFTQDPSSQTQYPGTFLGMIEKIPYLKKLGINAVELMPIYEFCEWMNPFVNPKTQQPLCNYWGYSTLNFFSPMRRYGTVEDFKQLVKALHREGIEVILDVVYNHTTEGNLLDDTLSFKGLDNLAYYMLSQKGEYLNYSGCGNTMQTNHVVMRSFILASLRYWVEQMHVDGFRFDLASILTRNHDGSVLPTPPVVEEISKDPVLANIKLIAEAWDAAGLYQVGSFPSFGKWAEWNGKYRDSVRCFWRGTEGQTGIFATRLCGSEDLYGSRAPYHSINFITAHDGFSLHDLVSYNTKHNLANGENNRDGTNDSESWNCGEEGPSSDPEIVMLRKRQMRNFLLTLLTSQGVPMLLMGDEYGHTKYGNNNTWSHDNRLNWFQWDSLEQDPALFAFCQKVIAIRKHFPSLRRSHFLDRTDIIFHGLQPEQPLWDVSSNFLAYTLPDVLNQSTLYVAFNAHSTPVNITLPHPPYQEWHLLIDTGLDAKQEQPIHALSTTYRLLSYSSIMLVSIAQHEQLDLL